VNNFASGPFHGHGPLQHAADAGLFDSLHSGGGKSIHFLSLFGTQMNADFQDKSKKKEDLLSGIAFVNPVPIGNIFLRLSAKICVQ
jgi:hypothetical protein